MRQILFSIANVPLALLTLTLTSSAVPPPGATTLPRYVNLSTSSMFSWLTVIGCVALVSVFISLVLEIFRLRPMLAEFFTTVEVFLCIWSCEWDS